MICKTGQRLASADFYIPMTLYNLPFVAFTRSRVCKSPLIQQYVQFYKSWYFFNPWKKPGVNKFPGWVKV